MDRNQIIGVALIFLILISWSALIQPKQAQKARERFVRDSIEQAQQILETTEDIAPIEQIEVVDRTESNDSIKQVHRQTQFGAFAEAASGTEEDFVLENDQVRITFTNKGGRIKEALLKDYKKVVDSEEGKEIKVDLHLLKDTKNRFDYLLPLQGKTVRSGDLYFTGVREGNRLRFVSEAGPGQRIEQEYILADEGYAVDYNLRLVGLGSAMASDNGRLRLRWSDYLDKLEKNVSFEQRYSTIYYKLNDTDDTDYCSCASDDKEIFDDERVDWISHSNQFFNSTLMAKDKPFESAELETTMLDVENEDLKKLESQIDIPLTGGADEVFAMQWYIGPNDFNRLAAFDNNLEEIIPFGRSIFGTINRWVIRPFFNFLSRYIGSTGVVIIVLIFIIKMLLYPLTYKMLYSQAKMAALKPEIEQAKKKFKDDQQKAQMETMKMYREYGVSPLGGCMPMILQMPIWYALFRFFPASLDFRQESFLWATDLSSYDVIAYLPFDIPMFGNHISLFTVLWAITTVMYTYYNTKHMDMSTNPAMKYVQYFMPVMFLVFFNTYASGLTCYMFFSNLINIAQTLVTKKFVFDEDKIRQELELERKKPKKKSGFQARLEEAMKQQQAQQANRKRRK